LSQFIPPEPTTAAICSSSCLVDIDMISFIGITSKRVIARAIVIAGTIKVSALLLPNKFSTISLYVNLKGFPVTRDFMKHLPRYPLVKYGVRDNILVRGKSKVSLDLKPLDVLGIPQISDPRSSNRQDIKKDVLAQPAPSHRFIFKPCRQCPYMCTSGMCFKCGLLTRTMIK
jgi:hypothetical protein